MNNIVITTGVLEYLISNDPDSLAYYLDEFFDILPENLQDENADADEMIRFISNYIDSAVSFIATEERYFSLEDGYCDYILFVKHNDKCYGIPYTEYYNEGYSVDEAKPIEEYPEYIQKDIIKTVYVLK